MSGGQESHLFRDHAALAVVLVVTGLLIFAIAAYSLTNRSLLYRYDQLLLEQLRSCRETSAPQWMLDIVNVLDKFGSVGTGLVTGAFGIYWIWKKRWRRLALLLLGVVGGTLLFLGLAFLIDRQRPVIVGLLNLVPLPSFPSGHMMASMGLYGALLYIYLPKLDSRAWSTAIFILACLLLLLIGFLRLFQGAHYLTDVVASLGLGLAWTAFGLTVVDMYSA